MILKIFKDEAMTSIRETIYNSKKIFFFLIDILSHTFVVSSKSKLLKYYDKYQEIKKEVKDYLEDLINETIIPNSENKEISQDIPFKAITSLFQLLSTKENISTISVCYQECN